MARLTALPLEARQSSPNRLNEGSNKNSTEANENPSAKYGYEYKVADCHKIQQPKNTESNFNLKNKQDPGPSDKMYPFDDEDRSFYGSGIKGVSTHTPSVSYTAAEPERSRSVAHNSVLGAGEVTHRQPKVNQRLDNAAEHPSQATRQYNNTLDQNEMVRVIVTPSNHRRNRYKRYIVFAVLVILSVFIGSVLIAYLAFGKSEAATNSALADYKDPSLKQVIILFRHGERTPTETYANDPYKNYPWEGGWGVLQKKGMKRMYKLGQLIRDHYGWLNNNTYNQSNTYAVSSYSERCIESTQALLAGLYPVSPKNAFIDNLLWRPIAVHSTPRLLDKIIIVKYPCPKLNILLDKAYMETVTSALIKYFDDLSKVAGQEIPNITAVEYLYNTLEIEEQEGFEIPDEMNKFYKDPRMLEIARQSYAIFTHYKDQKRLQGGPLLNSILRNMEEFNNGTNNYSIRLYGVHDITLVNLLRTMGVEKYNDELLKPDLGATLIFENRKESADKPSTVKIIYMNSSTDKPITIDIPNCFGNECSGILEDVTLRNVRDNYESVIPKNWDEECKVI